MKSVGSAALRAADLPDAASVAHLVRQEIGVREPVLAIVLGSGLGGLVKHLANARSAPYAEIPGFRVPSVPGHAGSLHSGELAGREVLVLSGRFHLYEGHDPVAATFPVRVAAALGAPSLLVSNAAGGIRRTFRPGDLMVINDHINLMWRNPLVGPVVTGDQRFPDMSTPYDRAMRLVLHECARKLGLALHDGVYAGLTGPSYETPSEVRMLERLGADAVGMSTVPEVLVARAIGLRVVAISCISNAAAGIAATPVRHADVMDVAARAGDRFERLVTEFVARGWEQ